MSKCDLYLGSGRNCILPRGHEGRHSSEPCVPRKASTALNGSAVISVTAHEWREADQHRMLDGARIMGRAIVCVEGGGQFNGLVVTKWSWHYETARMVELRTVVVWERDGTPAGVFRALPFDGKTQAI